MKAVRLLSGVAVAWMLAGCHLAVPQPEDVGTARRFTQVSLFSMLLCGRYGGVVDLGWVKDRGNLMIATMDRLDGEVMMVDGVVYQVKSDGTVRCPADGETIPYGTIADFRPETTETIGPIASYEDFETAMGKLFPDENIPLAVHLTGEFRMMRTRSVERQEKDGLGLAEASETESKFEMSDTAGDLVGFRLPGYLKGVNAPGWHLHYIDAGRKHGGHVLNFALKGGTLKACKCGQFDIRLPGCPSAFSGLDLSRDRSDELKRAEAER